MELKFLRTTVLDLYNTAVDILDQANNALVEVGHMLDDVFDLEDDDDVEDEDGKLDWTAMADYVAMHHPSPMVRLWWSHGGEARVEFSNELRTLGDNFQGTFWAERVLARHGEALNATWPVNRNG